VSVGLYDLLFARSLGHRFGAGAAPFGSAFRTRVPRPSGVGLFPPRRLRVPFQKLLLLATRLCRDLGAAHLCALWDVSRLTITLFGTVSNSATSRISKNGRKYTALGVSIISDRNLQAFHYNVVAFGKQGHFAKQLQTDTRAKLVVQAQSQPDNIATLPLLTATFVRPVRPVAVAPVARVYLIVLEDVNIIQ
jgi:hypothetical protein